MNIMQRDFIKWTLPILLIIPAFILILFYTVGFSNKSAVLVLPFILVESVLVPGYIKAIYDMQDYR